MDRQVFAGCWGFRLVFRAAGFPKKGAGVLYVYQMTGARGGISGIV